MPEFISIGTACNVKHQIDKHCGKKNTLFFDWLMTDMKSVITIISSNIDTILENVVKEPDGIYIKSLSYCVAIHDSMDDFVEKYNRRYARLMETIKSDKKIYFLRFGAIDEFEQQ
jgi:predicted ATP-dependent protease